MNPTRTLRVPAFFLALFASCLPLAALAAPTQLKVTGGEVDFTAIGRPSAIRIHGKGDAPTGTIDVQGTKVLGDLTFKLDSLDTGIEMRNHHMKEKYLETGKYPTAGFKITKMELPKEWSTPSISAEGVAVEALLTLHGQTHPVAGQASVTKSGSNASAHVEFGIALTDYGIEIPSFAGIKVADHVDISVDLQAQPASK